jgi:hypothetical protein
MPPNTSAWTGMGSDPWWVSHSPVIAYPAGSQSMSMLWGGGCYRAPFTGTTARAHGHKARCLC